MDYEIVYDTDRGSLVKKVTSMIRGGWEPQGGVCSSYIGETEVLYQAMVRKRK